MLAAMFSIALGQLEQVGRLTQAWRYLFLIGALPAFLVVVVILRVGEPERWKTASLQQAQARMGSLRELLGAAKWRRHALVGLVLAVAGVVGLWGIGFFSYDLIRSVLAKPLAAEARERGGTDADRLLASVAISNPEYLDEIAKIVRPSDLFDAEARGSYDAVLHLRALGKPITRASVADSTGRSPPAEIDAPAIVSSSPEGSQRVVEIAERIAARTKEFDGNLTFWAGITSLLLNFGGLLGIDAFRRFTPRIGRRPAFAIGFSFALASTAMTFWYLESFRDIFWMIPLMGFGQMSVFGGYAIYFPELFPTRIRSTGTSFCYNAARLLAAVGPLVLGLLTSQVFVGFPREPMRYAGVAMCSFFLLGLVALPFAPETNRQPLPD
jgi:MFS family permease